MAAYIIPPVKGRVYFGVFIGILKVYVHWEYFLNIFGCSFGMNKMNFTMNPPGTVMKKDIKKRKVNTKHIV